MKYISLLIIVMLTTSIGKGQSQWQVGFDASLFVSKYVSHDLGNGFKPTFAVPGGSGEVVVSYLLRQRGLYVESGIGYRNIKVAYATKTGFSNGYSAVNGISLWYIPILLRQDIISVLFPSWKKKYRLSIKGGFINCIVARNGFNGDPFSVQGATINLTARSEVKNYYSPILSIGAELRFPIVKQRIYGLLQMNRLFGLSDILRMNINYSQNGVSNSAYISNLGSGYSPLGIGLRYNFY